MKSVNTDQALIEAIDALLSQHTDGLSEYDLIEALNTHYPTVYPKPDLSDTLILFQHHFFLRHCVYQLKDQLKSQLKSQLKNHYGLLPQDTTVRWQLEISPVKIRKVMHQPSSQNLPTENDPLETYYLDLANLNKESETSVNSMLDGFWKALAKYQHQPQALETLGLSGSETYAEQKKRYRTLAQQHHPDKGGDAAEFDKIQQAWQQLAKKP